MFNVIKEGIRRVFGENSKVLTRGTEASVDSVNEERLWIGVAKRVVTCMKSNGFYYETKETPPPFVDVDFGVFCEVALVDKTGASWEATLQSFHYPGDKGETQIMQIGHKEYNSLTFVTVEFRSNENMIRLSPDSTVRKQRWISSHPRELDLSEKLQLLGKLSRVKVDERKTLELFEGRQKDGRFVRWIRDKDIQLLPGDLE
jgi:hypothetical protein